MKSYILFIVVLISMLFVSNTNAEFCNILSSCGEGRCCTSLIFGYCQPLGKLGGPCDTKTDTEHFCGCESGLKCSNNICVAK